MQAFFFRWGELNDKLKICDAFRSEKDLHQANNCSINGINFIYAKGWRNATKASYNLHQNVKVIETLKILILILTCDVPT